jgi:hypothetical protein
MYIRYCRWKGLDVPEEEQPAQAYEGAEQQAHESEQGEAGAHKYAAGSMNQEKEDIAAGIKQSTGENEMIREYMEEEDAMQIL